MLATRTARQLLRPGARRAVATPLLVSSRSFLQIPVPAESQRRNISNFGMPQQSFGGGPPGGYFRAGQSLPANTIIKYVLKLPRAPGSFQELQIQRECGRKEFDS